MPDAHELSALMLQAQLGALTSVKQIVAVIPQVMAGQGTERASLLSFLASQVTPLEHRVEDLFETASADGHVSWKLPELGISTDLETVAEQHQHRATYIKHEFAQNPNLIPEYLSHSQMSTLVSRPFEWLLQYQLLIKEAPAADIPTGNRMVGTFMHKLAENLFKAAQPSGPLEVSREDIAREFDRLMPSMAAEFSLPGNYKEKMERREEVINSLDVFFTLLKDAGITITGMEVPLGEEELTLSDTRNPAYPQTRTGRYLEALKGRGGKPLLLVGSRDVDVRFADGRRGVVDLKYAGSNSSKKYPQFVKMGEATQLATYAASVASENQEISDVPVGFFLLKQGTMNTANEEFFAGDTSQVLSYSSKSKTPQTTASLEELWNKLTLHISNVLQGIADGVAFDIDTYRVLLQDAGQSVGASGLSSEEHELLSTELQEAISIYDQDALQLRKGFFPSSPNVYSNYPVITGVQGDFDELR